MTMRGIAAAAVLACCVAAVAAPAPQAQLPAKPALSVQEIIAKNVAARGGIEAWRKIETMTWAGHVQGATESTPPMAFVMELRRPNQTHFEIATADNRRFTRIFDGTKGWRVRPAGNGFPELKAFSKEEVAFSRDEYVIDGPLVDYDAKGVAVKLAGLDEIEGRKAYLLEVTLPGGASRRVWVDAETFLDFRSDRPSTNPVTRGAPVSVYYGDFRPVDGVLIPHLIETRSSSGGGASQTLVIDRVALNPPLPNEVFAKPRVPTPPRRHGATVDARSPAVPRTVQPAP